MLVLAAVLAAALLLRLAPLTAYPVWGSDTGEYAFITEHILRTGRPPADYAGWGFAYPFFPGMEYVAAGVARVTGLEPLTVLQLLVPALNVVSVYAIYRIARRIARGAPGGDGGADVPDGSDRADDVEDPTRHAHRAGLGAAAVAAVAMPLVFTGSHPMPESLGHALALVVVYLALDADLLPGDGRGRDGRDRDGRGPDDRGPDGRAAGAGTGAADGRRRWAAAALLGLAVVVTHHLSTYMMLLALAGLWLGRLLRSRDDPAWSRLALTVLLGAAALAYWTWAAPPFRDRILTAGASAPLLWAAALAVAGGAAVLARLRPRLGWTWRPGPHDPAKARRFAAAMLAAAAAAVAAFLLVGVPGLTFRIDPVAALWFAPMVLLFGAVPLGTARLRAAAEAPGLYAWIGLVGLSFVVGAAALPTVLIPYRHVPYLMAPVAVLAGRGLVEVATRAGPDPPRDRPTPSDRPTRSEGRIRSEGPARSGRGFGPRSRVRITSGTAAAVVLLVLLAATAYPPPSVLGGFQEGITAAEMAGMEWAGTNLPAGSTFLADHRLSSVLFGLAGMAPSWDAGEAAWYAASFDEARPVLQDLSMPRGSERVDHVMLSPVTEQGVALTQWQRARPLTGAALEKFDAAPFQPLYDQDGVRILRIDWAAVE